MTQKTREKVERWVRAVKAVKQLKSQLNSAECEEANSQNDLGKWLCDADAKPGEVFNIWIGSGVLQAIPSSSNSNDFKVSWRREPDGKDREQMGL